VQGDPTARCTGYPDCGENSVWYGSQNATNLCGGQCDWASATLITPGQAGGGTAAISISENQVTHAGKITVAFTFVDPTLPVVINGKVVLANVAFGLVGRGNPGFFVSDVNFVDHYANSIPGIQGAAVPTVGAALASDIHFKFVNATNVPTETWAPGKTIVYDTNNDNLYTGGEPVVAGYTAPTVVVGTKLKADPNIKFIDTNGNGIWTGLQIAEPVFYDVNGNNIYDASELIVSCTILSCGAPAQNIVNDPPHVSFTSTHTGSKYTFTVTATDAENDITNYIWDFGDRTPNLNTALTTVTHDYGVSGFRTAPGRFFVSVRAIDALGATGAARSSKGLLLTNNQPSHAGADLGIWSLVLSLRSPLLPRVLALVRL